MERAVQTSLTCNRTIFLVVMVGEWVMLDVNLLSFLDDETDKLPLVLFIHEIEQQRKTTVLSEGRKSKQGKPTTPH